MNVLSLGARMHDVAANDSHCHVLGCTYRKEGGRRGGGGGRKERWRGGGQREERRGGGGGR